MEKTMETIRIFAGTLGENLMPGADGLARRGILCIELGLALLLFSAILI